MNGPVALSVIITTHADKSHLEALLLTLTRINHPGIELIVINDAADEELSSSIRKILGQTDNDQVYYFEHDTPCGRGYCLNEGLVQSSGMLIWTPLQASRLNESLLTDAIRKFKSDPASFWSLDFSLPDHPVSWIDAAEDANLPDDTCLVWNRTVIGSKNLIFNSFLNELHGAELAMRLSGGHTWHKTDPFFVLSENQSFFAQPADIREFLFSALRMDPDSDTQGKLLQKLQSLDHSAPSFSRDEQLLLDARRYLNSGDANKSLEFISSYLRKYPRHLEANRIKITSLEKLRRHVEAAELKHRLQKEQREEQKRQLMDEKEPVKPASDAVSEEDKSNDQSRFIFDGGEKVEPHHDIESSSYDENPEPSESVKPSAVYSVIIPTAAAGKAILEQTLIQLGEIADPSDTELIIIDNASIDDTFDYLEQLKEKKFLNLKTITNSRNKGFSASLNQGFDVASGEYLIVMHNDVLPGENLFKELRKAFEKNDRTGISVPVLNSTAEPAQLAQENETASYLPAKSTDSCCFMVKRDRGFRFDEEFGLSFFDMKDFCMQVMDAGYEIFVAAKAQCKHAEGKTSSMLGLQMVPFLKWTNKDRFNRKWGESGETQIPPQGSHPDRIKKLGIPQDPLNPDVEWVDAIQNYLTSEVRTDILRTDWAENDLITIISALIIADERELLRTLEDRLDELELPAAFLLLIIEYYFSKNIFSRCRHYLDKGGKTHPAFDLYRLKILVADKETEKASPLLTSMLDKYPASPDLMRLAGDIYRQNGDQDEAKSFYALASQIDPFRFSADEMAYELKL